MKIITAPEKIEYSGTGLFLAGGISKCPQWQNQVIEALVSEDVTVLNPRREPFPMNDPNSEREQIDWEFYALETASIFSMWFCNAPSDQPICLYELGRHLTRWQLSDKPEHVVIGIEPGYNRSRDVILQTQNISPRLASEISNSLDQHIKNIITAIRNEQTRKN